MESSWETVGSRREGHSNLVQKRAFRASEGAPRVAEPVQQPPMAVEASWITTPLQYSVICVARHMGDRSHR